MQKQNLYSLTIIVIFTLLMVACSSGNRIGGTSKHCGCGVNKGMVGY
jgi:hypothetical protein